MGKPTDRVTGCAIPDTGRICDKHAERMVLCGILHDGKLLSDRLNAFGLERGHFYDDTNQKAFDLFSFVANGCQPPILADVYCEMLVRHRQSGKWLEGNFGTSLLACMWLVDLWSVTMWLADDENKGMIFWADIMDNTTSYYTWSALAAAAKVKHLAKRRWAIHTASAIIADAVNTSDENPDDRLDYLGEF